MASRRDGRMVLIGVALVLVAAGLALIAVGRGCRAEPPPPATSIAPTTPTPSATPAVPTSTAVLVTRQTPTGEPTLAQVTSLPVTVVYVTSTPAATPTARISPTPRPSMTPVAPTPTTASRGVHRVERGDTLWSIACGWYGNMSLLPGANPLTPCTCWRGIYAAGPQIRPPQIIYPGERYVIPVACGQ